jgi:hypothetical protein
VVLYRVIHKTIKKSPCQPPVFVVFVFLVFVFTALGGSGETPIFQGKERYSFLVVVFNVSVAKKPGTAVRYGHFGT